jgi:ABC-type transport system involved in multi-copper enzyme maturation permease subunit
MTASTGWSGTNTASDWCLRLAGAGALVNGLGFGGFTIPAIRNVSSGNGVLYAYGNPTYGHGPLDRLGVPTAVPLLVAFLMACTVLAAGGVLLLWPRTSGILVSLIGIVVCAPFWWGFDLPFAWPNAAHVIILIAIGWTLRRSRRSESSQEGRPMTALISAELLKLCTRAHAGVLLVAMIFVPIAVSSEIPEPGKGGTALPIYDPDLLTLAVGTGFVVPMVFIALLGGVAVTQEFRYGTVTSTYLIEPRRHRVLIAKSVALAVAGVLTTVVTLMVAVPVAVALISSRGGELVVGVRFWQMMGGGTAVLLVYAVVGVVIGALIRNQVVFVVTALVWMLAVEHMIIPAHMSVGRWLPVAAAYQLMQLGPSVDPDGRLLSVAASGILLAAYATIVIVLTFRLTPGRDIH